jgi:hypothetical protein
MKLLPRLRFSLSLLLLAASLTAADPVADDLQKSLAGAHVRLEQLQQRYGDAHPNIVEAKATIAALEKQIAAHKAAGSLPPPRTISVDFPGGTFSALSAAISKTDGAYFNLIGEQSDLTTELPAFSVRNASPEIFAAALNQLLTPRGLEIKPGGNMINGEGTVFVIAKSIPRRPVASSEPTQFESYQLGSLLGKQSVDDIVDAIRQAWELDPTHKANALVLKFHPPTKLLLVSGSSAAINVARQVIAAIASLPRDNAPRPAPKN